jgi:hypothetical protein
MIEHIVKKVLLENFGTKMILKENVYVSKELEYILENNFSLTNNNFKKDSRLFIDLLNEVRELYDYNLIALNDKDIRLVESDYGRKVILENGQMVYLEIPVIDHSYLNEAEYQGRKVQLGKIMQGDIKKFKVYVKNDKGKVVKVNFGFGGKSAKGKRMVIKKNNPQRRKSFRARHNCDNPGPRWKARYWACRTW